MTEKLTRQTLDHLAEKIDAGEYVPRNLLRSLAYTARQFEYERRFLAKLAADTPQFNNPLDVVAVKRLRDDILSGADR